jgi:hypothetical protein
MIARERRRESPNALMSARIADSASFGVMGALVPEARRRSAHAILPYYSAGGSTAEQRGPGETRPPHFWPPMQLFSE